MSNNVDFDEIDGDFGDTFPSLNSGTTFEFWRQKTEYLEEYIENDISDDLETMETRCEQVFDGVQQIEKIPTIPPRYERCPKLSDYNQHGDKLNSIAYILELRKSAERSAGNPAQVMWV